MFSSNGFCYCRQSRCCRQQRLCWVIMNGVIMIYWCCPLLSPMEGWRTPASPLSPPHCWYAMMDLCLSLEGRQDSENTVNFDTFLLKRKKNEENSKLFPLSRKVNLKTVDVMATNHGILAERNNSIFAMLRQRFGGLLLPCPLKLSRRVIDRVCKLKASTISSFFSAVNEFWMCMCKSKTCWINYQPIIDYSCLTMIV